MPTIKLVDDINTSKASVKDAMGRRFFIQDSNITDFYGIWIYMISRASYRIYCGAGNGDIVIEEGQGI